jgi:hypothetical protein
MWRFLAWVAVVAAGPGLALADAEEDEFLQKRAEKTLLNVKDTDAYRDSIFTALGSLEKLPKGYESLIRVAEAWKVHAAKTPKEAIAGDTWRKWYLRVMISLTRQKSVKADPKLFPDKLIEDYAGYLLADDKDKKTRSANLTG